MSDSSRLPVLLFGVTLLCAIVLMAAAAGGPLLSKAIPQSHDVILLFGEDMMVRRTAFVSSLGLFATAFVFFRPSAKKAKKPAKETVNMSGA